jgi:hypothetical protein
MSMPRRHLSRRLTAAGVAICGVVALGGCASMSTVSDKDFSNSGSSGGNGGGGTHNGGGGTHNGGGNGGHGSSSDNGTVSIYARHSQKVVVRNESHQVVHSTTMSRGEHVSYSLGPGTYTIVATSSSGVCVVTVNVRSNATTRTTIGC